MTDAISIRGQVFTRQEIETALAQLNAPKPGEIYGRSLVLHTSASILRTILHRVERAEAVFPVADLRFGGLTFYEKPEYLLKDPKVPNPFKF